MIFRYLLPGLALIALMAFQKKAIVEWISPTEHDFGDLRSREEVTHQFQFRNISADTLHIDNVRAACGCTAPAWTDGPIPPGDEARITVDYDARDNGYFRRYIKVYFDKQRKAEKLWITGFVE